MPALAQAEAVAHLRPSDDDQGALSGDLVKVCHCFDLIMTGKNLCNRPIKGQGSDVEKFAGTAFTFCRR